MALVTVDTANHEPKRPEMALLNAKLVSVRMLLISNPSNVKVNKRFLIFFIRPSWLILKVGGFNDQVQKAQHDAA
jgi:hypothetical protein